jgi:hypothetical protein
VLAAGASIMEVRALLDNSGEAAPGPVFFSQDDHAFRSHAFNFLFVKVAPGAHRVEVQFRNAGKSGLVHVGHRTAMVHFAK